MVNVDTVYQTVQALINKEQRGYLTPQEFNLFANQAQQDIFEQYFYDIDAMRQQRPEEHVIGNTINDIMDKVNRTNGMTVSASAGVSGGTTLPPGRTGRIFVDIGGFRKTARLVNADEIQTLRGSRWHKAGFTEAVYFENGFKQIEVWSGANQITSAGTVTCESITGNIPLVYWNYIIVNEKATYDATTSQNFSLPLEEQPDLVINILKLAGISIEDREVYGAGQEGQSLNIQQENK